MYFSIILPDFKVTNNDIQVFHTDIAEKNHRKVKFF